MVTFIKIHEGNSGDISEITNSKIHASISSASKGEMQGAMKTW